MESLGKTAENIENTENIEVPENFEGTEDTEKEDLAEFEDNQQSQERLEDEIFDYLGLDKIQKNIEKNIQKEIKRRQHGLPTELIESPDPYTKLLDDIENGRKPTTKCKYGDKYGQIVIEICSKEAKEEWSALPRQKKMLKLAEDLDDFVSAIGVDNYDGYEDIQFRLSDKFDPYDNSRWYDNSQRFKTRIYNHLQRGIIYKDIKKMTEAISKNPRDFYFYIPLREVAATLITRMVEVDANHGADPARRIGRAALKLFKNDDLSV